MRSKAAQYWRDLHDLHQRHCARRLRFAISITVGLAVTAAVGLLAFAANDIGPVSEFWGIKDIIGLGEAITKNAAVRFGWPTYVHNRFTPFAIAFLAGAIPAWFAWAGSARRWAEHFFPAYCPIGFDPVVAPAAEIGADRVLPWASDSVMDEIFQKLRQRFTDQAATGSDKRPLFKPFSKPVVPLPFEHILLLGRPGAGKSRLAEHLARQLGRRDILGDKGSGNAAQPAAARALAIGERRRRWMWWRARLPGDPWDSGIISGPVPDALALWRPARPTLFWMDDPRAADAQAWLTKLTEYAPLWRHPVRLVIANQSRLDGVADPVGDNIIVLKGDTYFTPAQIIALAKADRLNPFTPEDAEQVHRLSEGNPLLVQLAFELIRGGKTLGELTQDSLVAQRVIRVMNALKSADATLVTPNALRALAFGTLAGPSCPMAEADRAFPGHGLGASALARAFPVEAGRIKLNERLPMIRPELVGDAFVRHIVETESASIATELRDALFRLDPERWLRATQRLGRGADQTANAFASAPTGFETSGPEWQEAALRLWIGHGQFGWRDCVKTAQQIDALFATKIAPQSQQATAARLLDWHMEAVESDWQARCLAGGRWRAALAEAKTTVQAAAEQERAATTPLAHRFMSGDAIMSFALMLAAHKFGVRTENPPALTVEDLRERMDFADRLIAVGRVYERGGAKDALRDWAWRLFGAGRRAIDLSDAALFAQLRREVNWRRTVGVAARISLRQALSRMATEQAAPPERIFVWSQRLDAYGNNDDPTRCRAALEQIEVIASQAAYANDCDMQYERAAAWCILANAKKDDPTRCRAALEKVEAIASQAAYANDRDMQLERAFAWRFLAEAEQDDPARCRSALEKVEAIASQAAYANDSDMQLERAVVWRLLALAEHDDPARCRGALEKVEAIASQAAYANNRDMQFERAAAWHYLAFAERANAAAHIPIFARLKAACAPWGDDPEFADVLAKARSYLPNLA